MLKIDNTSTNSITNFKGYVGKSVYKFYQNGLNNRVTELKKEKGRFDNIPLIYLNQILEEKKDIIKALEKLKETAKKHYHKTTKIIIGPYTGEDAQKGDKSMRIANDLLPDVSLPIMKQTQNWYPYKINTGQYGIKTVIMNINEPKNVINNEADLLDAWYYDNVQYFGSNSIGDRLFRFMTGIKARIKGKRLGINKETVNQIIKNGNEKCKKTELNRLEEQKFLKSLKI